MSATFNEQDILAALTVFQSAPNKLQIEQANDFLSNFQHSANGWAICNKLLMDVTAPHAARLFAAQTFRSKVTYDLRQLSLSEAFELKDTLMSAFVQYRGGPRTIQTQLCLAIACLAVQLPQWQSPIQEIILAYKSNVETVPILLEFLTILPEEVNGNTKIPISNEEFGKQLPLLLSDNAKQILELLTIYVQAPGVTSNIQNQVFGCLRSWVNAGEIQVTELTETPLLDFAFQALSSEQLFETSVDLICDIIHETQEVYDNENVINLLLPRLVSLKKALVTNQDDIEIVRGLTRIFTEAGETYRQLIIQHTSAFFPLVEAIVVCTSYHDLDIVPITFNFWYRLAQSLGKQNEIAPPFLEAYSAVLKVIVQHLHFPSDSIPVTGQEADDFRNFRHVMGDTLKDCCYILGTTACLTNAYKITADALDIARTTGGTDISWQNVEAPLFAMRSMGGEVDVNDEVIVPKIMDLIPSLPSHPRIQYAAMLVVARYTEWIDAHPSYIPFQLTYLSSGFGSSDAEVSAAAAQAMKNLCKDCKRHLVSSLPQLHAFVSAMGPTVTQDDKLQIYEAIGHIISCMPAEQGAASLRSFAFDILTAVHDIMSKPAPIAREELMRIADHLEHLETLLQIVESFGDELPESCINTCSETWAILDRLLQQHGSFYFITERVTRVLRFGLQIFNAAALTVVPSVLTCLATSFEQTGFSSYLWIAAKIVQRFGGSQDAAIRDPIMMFYASASLKVSFILNEKSAAQHPDVIEDYLQLTQSLVDNCPAIFLQSSGLETAFVASMAALTLLHGDIVFASLDFLCTILSQESIKRGSSDQKSLPLLVNRINDIFALHGFQLTKTILVGLVGDFPEESLSSVIQLVRCIAAAWPQQLSHWMPSILDALPPLNCPSEAKTSFAENLQNSLANQQPDKVKNAVTNLFRSSRKARDRRDLKAR